MQSCLTPSSYVVNKHKACKTFTAAPITNFAVVLSTRLISPAKQLSTSPPNNPQSLSTAFNSRICIYFNRQSCLTRSSYAVNKHKACKALTAAAITNFAVALSIRLTSPAKKLSTSPPNNPQSLSTICA